MGRHTLSQRRIQITALVAAAGVLLAAGAALAMAQHVQSSGPRSEEPQAQRLREIERTRLRALVDANVAVAAPLHASGFRLVNPAGQLLGRDDYLAAVAAGDIDYLVFEPISEIEVHLFGRAAVLIYKSRIDIRVSGLGRLTHEAWHTYLYEKRAGRWQAVWEQATAIGGLPQPQG